MSKRLQTLNVRKFTAFCFAVLGESESRGDVIEEDELFDLALELAEESEDTAISFCARFHGFIAMAFQPEAKDYVFRDSEQIRFHPALFEVAACARTRKNGSFAERPFFKRVREVAAGKYHDFSFDD